MDQAEYHEQLRVEKQQYLVDQIIEKGYDPSDFIAFCETKRGSNIDLYEIEELKHLVSEFTKLVDRALEEEEEEKEELKVEVKESSSSSSSSDSMSPSHDASEIAEEVSEIATEEVPSASQESEVVSEYRITVITAFPAIADEGTPIDDDILDFSDNSPLPSDNEDIHSSVAVHTTGSQIEPDSPTTNHSLRSGSYDLRLEEEVKSNPLSYTVEALSVPLSSLSICPPPSITVRDPRVETGGKLSQSFATYFIETYPLGWTTRRRFSDFEWLRKILVEQFPGYFVPPCPKALKINKHVPETLLKRSRFFERLLNSMMKCPLLRRSEIVCCFLRDDPESFKKFKASFKKTKKPSSPSEYPSLDGTLRCDIGTASDYNNRVSKLLLESQNVKYRIRKKGQEVASTINALSTQLRELSALFLELDSVLNVLPENKVANKALCSFMGHTFGKWSLTESEVSRQFREAFGMHFKYEVAQIASLKSLLSDRETAFTNFTKAEIKLNAKKEKLWTSSNPSKWEMAANPPPAEVLKQDKDKAFKFMLHAETQQYFKLRDTYGFLNYQSKAEVGRVLEETTYSDNLHFTGFSEFLSRVYVGISEHWGQAYSDLKSAAHDYIPEPQYLRII
mmetsp:Transcript_26557/g.47701  ORF Transcript_26557/g.47701 Transcript_26557/m.47701 type:complete len:621 (+) Transcript_26557:579-2441(+)|eukprot:CAMPEP_0204910000 /NCGR_PEP_ID=MMETSP1397-20131031/8602_1 /ASSEMBLY_ACC=CAM_ASM_000891 /TAXON_ID=49980 /ORGANISM="Climacostomum Climacostomum virens, Strain Stock W-24" /LENGTH=620 /DNA_ID=CAMNT_0052079993 /DNA_START=539 /DNA_END=2401 /DNA_ORIENTATION=-